MTNPDTPDTRFTLPPSWVKVRRVLIGGWCVVVEYDPDLEEYGKWFMEKRLVRVGPLAETCFAETLRHELRHATLDISGLSWAEHHENESLVRAFDHILDPAWESIQHLIT